MLAPDVKFTGFTAREWSRLVEALRPDPMREAAPATTSGGVILVTEGRRLVKALHTERGRLDPRDVEWPESLVHVAEQHRVRFAAELQVGALKALFDRFAFGLSRHENYTEQLLRLLGLVREFEAEGRLRLWSKATLHWPVPSYRTLERALDALCPVGQTLLFGVFRRGELHTCIALSRARQGFDRIVGPSVLGPRMGLVSGDWSRDYRYLLQATESLMGPVCLGCFGELVTFQGLAGFARAGAWAEAVAMREVILSPVVPALAIPLGLDLGLAAVEGVRSMAERAKLREWLNPGGPLDTLLGRIVPLVPNLKTLLGFDPLSLLYQLFEKRSHRE